MNGRLSAFVRNRQFRVERKNLILIIAASAQNVFVTDRQTISVSRKKSPNVHKSCPIIISQAKWKILTSLEKLAKNVSDLGKIIVATGFEKLPKVQ